MQILDAAATAARLPYPALADAIAAMLADLRAGVVKAPARMAVPVSAGGTLLLMPAADATYAMVKMITVHAGNPARGLPAILGEVVVMDAATGVRRMLLDAPTVTSRRTAAVSLLAARSFAARPDGALLVVGAGVQARAHVEAWVAGLGTRHVLVCSRSAEHAEALVQHAQALGAQAEMVASVAAALPRVTMVVTATTSLHAVLPDLANGLWQPHHFVAGVGAFRPEMCELPAALCLQAAAQGRLVADTLSGLEHEAGDLLQAGVDWSLVRPFEQAIEEAAGLRAEAGPLVFKSVGDACWDLAAARLAIGNF